MKRTFQPYKGKFRYAHVYVVPHIASMALDGTTREVICNFEGRKRPVLFVILSPTALKKHMKACFLVLRELLPM